MDQLYLVNGFLQPATQLIRKIRMAVKHHHRALQRIDVPGKQPAVIEVSPVMSPVIREVGNIDDVVPGLLEGIQKRGIDRAAGKNNKTFFMRQCLSDLRMHFLRPSGMKEGKEKDDLVGLVGNERMCFLPSCPDKRKDQQILQISFTQQKPVPHVFSLNL